MVLAQKQTQGPKNKREDPNMSTQNYAHLILDKDDKNILWKRGIVFNK